MKCYTIGNITINIIHRIYIIQMIMLLMEKGKKRGKPIIDEIDWEIFDLISRSEEDKKKISIGVVREKLDISWPGIIRHLKKLEPFIQRQREHNIIYLTLTDDGKSVRQIFLRALPLMDGVVKMMLEKKHKE